MEKKYSVSELITVIIFVLIIGVMSVVDIMYPDKKFSENENRMLAQMPALSLETVGNAEFMLGYETYVTDQFIGRDSWITVKTLTEIFLAKKDVNDVFIGDDGYYIETMDSTTVDDEKVSSNIEYLVNFAKKAEKLVGKEHVNIMLVPTASEILSDKLPSNAVVYSQKGLIDRLKSELEKAGFGDVFVDVSEVLKNHSEEDIYYRTDHHWTTYGAYLAYSFYAESKGFVPTAKEDFDITVVSDDFLGTIHSKLNISISDKDKIEIYDNGNSVTVEYNMDGKKLSSMYEMSHLEGKDKYAMFLNSNNALVQIDVNRENADGEHKSIAVIKDSYANCFVPFLTEHYDTIYVIDLRYLNMPVSSFIRSYNVNDVLVLYNVRSFTSDVNVFKIAR